MNESNSPQTVEVALSRLRIIYSVLIFSLMLYMPAAWYIGPRVPGGGRLPMLLASILSAFTLGLAFIMRRRFIITEFAALRARGQEKMAVGKWYAGGLLSAVLWESIGVYGLGAHILGAALTQTLPFYIVPILPLILFFPRRP